MVRVVDHPQAEAERKTLVVEMDQPAAILVANGLVVIHLPVEHVSLEAAVAAGMAAAVVVQTQDLEAGVAAAVDRVTM